jgi:hypothetical protein
MLAVGRLGTFNNGLRTIRRVQLGLHLMATPIGEGR